MNFDNYQADITITLDIDRDKFIDMLNKYDFIEKIRYITRYFVVGNNKIF